MDDDKKLKKADDSAPSGLGLKLVLLFLFAMVFFILRACGVIDELPLKLGVFEGFFK